MNIKVYSPTTIVVASVILFCCGILPSPSSSNAGHTVLADLDEKKQQRTSSKNNHIALSDSSRVDHPAVTIPGAGVDFHSQIHEALMHHHEEKKLEDTAIVNQEHRGKKQAPKKKSKTLQDDDKRNNKNPGSIANLRTDPDTKNQYGTKKFSPHYYIHHHDLVIDGKRIEENKNTHDEEWNKDKKSNNATRDHGTTASHLDRDLIVNGEPANDAYPWFAKPLLENVWFIHCGGSLIKPNWVLTAAHCFYRKSGIYVGGLYEKYGRYEIGGTEKIDIARVFKHEQYVYTTNPQILPEEFDIALVCLKTKAKAQPVPYDKEDKVTKKSISDGYEDLTCPGCANLWASGYGKMENDQYPGHLRHVPVSYIKRDDCDNDKYNGDKEENNGLLTSSMMCAAGLNNEGTCNGDSGGPLYDADNKVIVGVNSAGLSNCAQGIIDLNNPDVYTRISSYAQWIEDKIEEEKKKKPSSSPSESPSGVPSTEPSAEPSPFPSPSGPSQSPSPTQTSSGNGPSQSPSPTPPPLTPSNPQPSTPSNPPPSTPSTPPPSPTITPSPPPTGNGNGDPHFTTFAGKSFDYHGECDLVMISSGSFASGSGLAVHVRTTRVDGPMLSYSYIFGAAVGIGKDNVMEVQVDGSLVVNGQHYAATKEKEEPGADKDNAKSDVTSSSSSSDNDKRDKNGVTPMIPDTFATYPLVKNMIGKKKRIVQYILSLTDNDGNSITITVHANPRTHMLFVKIDGDIDDGVGLLGHPRAGDRLMGRDGITDMSNDWNAYGEEWQVRDFEPKLFQDQHRAPQYPSGCVYESHQDQFHHPKHQQQQQKKTTNLRRRLLGKTHSTVINTPVITMEDATNACEDYIGVKREHCVHDVMAVGDLEVADDPAYA